MELIGLTRPVRAIGRRSSQSFVHLHVSFAVDNDLSGDIALHKRQWIILFCVPPFVLLLVLCFAGYYKAEVSGSVASLSPSPHSTFSWCLCPGVFVARVCLRGDAEHLVQRRRRVQQVARFVALPNQASRGGSVSAARADCPVLCLAHAMRMGAFVLCCIVCVFVSLQRIGRRSRCGGCPTGIGAACCARAGTSFVWRAGCDRF